MSLYYIAIIRYNFKSRLIFLLIKGEGKGFI